MKTLIKTDNKSILLQHEEKVISNSATCILIGEDHLVMKCAQILINNNYLIRGIISPFSTVNNWSLKNNIPVYQTFDEANQILDNERIDYLFSIVNSKIIPKYMFDKIKKFSINYHHSPLPKYAGINATSWAILNDEQIHGITWHLITDVIDGGDIIKQAIFKIKKQETGLSLNHKCYQHAVTSFSELALELCNKTFTTTKQNNDQRSYYGLNKKPPGNGLVDWKRPGEEIERYFRALSFGMYDNALCTLKINIKNNYYVILDLEISSLKSKQPPGTIDCISGSFWSISSTTYDIILKKISNLKGVECSLGDLVKKYQLKKGDILKSLENKYFHLFSSISSDISRYEAFWINEIRMFEPAELPFINEVSFKGARTFQLTMQLNLPNSLINKAKKMLCQDMDISVFFFTIWIIYLHRIGNKKNLGISLVDTSSSFNKQIDTLFSKEIPFFITLDDSFDFKKALIVVNNQLNKIKNKQTFLKDIFYRYQSIANLSDFIPISVILDNGKNENHITQVSNSVVVLRISIIEQQLKWYVDETIIHKNTHLLQCIKNCSKHIEVLINSVLKNPNQLISTLPLLTMREKQILLTRNTTKLNYPKNKNINFLMQKTFEINPYKIAIQTKDAYITYNELQVKVNNLSLFLKEEIGVKSQENVIIHMQRSIDWIVSVLAINKIGAIYIPVASNTPTQQLQLIINDSKANFILCDDSLMTNINLIKGDLIRLNITPTLKKLPDGRVNKNISNFSSKHIAYVLYTSGTTGAPKGVIIRHYSLVNLIIEQIRRLNINHQSNVLQFASIGFDASIWEIFSILTVGGTLCIPPESDILIGKKLSETINKFNISLITLPPSILQTISVEEVKTLDTIVTAGEACSKELANQWIKHVCLINAYGPTETTVCATMGKVINNDINIGKPIANTQAYILDDKHNFVPDGVIGELYIGGDSVALGYLNQPELTRQYFISNPFFKKINNLIYRTKDLVRWLPDGNIDYIGRIDHQIKIRGLRIEPEAIETQILHHPDITQCVVSLKQNDKLEKFIVAYLVSTQKVDLHHLRESIGKHLPHYMIPNFFIELKGIPLTTNGKIDRNALPMPDLKYNINHDDYIPPSTFVEKKLCKIWSNLLGMQKVGIHDDFFTVGGNSLLLSQLIISLKEHFDVDVHFLSILKNPTISSISHLLIQKDTSLIKDEHLSHIMKDTHLKKDIKQKHSIPTKKSKVIFLTGATGFLGTHLLNQLSSNNLTIYCPIRANSDVEAKELLLNSLNRYGLDSSIHDQIIPICGDISRPELGLKHDISISLAKEIDEIYHNAASVHHLYNYEMLRSTNVESTIELLKFAGQFKNKKINYISTLSALHNHTDNSEKIIENFIIPDINKLPDNGYNQTKWVSETLLYEAYIRGFSINIFRPGWILGRKIKDSNYIRNNHLLSLIKGCVQLNYAPDWNIDLDILTVDFLSKMIVSISMSNCFENKVFNFSNTNKISWIEIINILNEFGHNIKVIPQNDWINSLKDTTSDHALFNLLPLYVNPANDMENNLNKVKKCNDSNVSIAMKMFNESYPIINKELLLDLFYFLS